ncbi:MAG: NAD(P)/FAD-dependent oxidoreductase [Planctomycetes bacterium]|nr:NAD(P)/FAD-dependent oxidoreductase [Planctomycetota bacterium]
MDELDCEVLVVGAGPAGVAAAATAAECGRDVLVVDDNRHPGGQIWRRSVATGTPSIAERWLGRAQSAGARFAFPLRIADAHDPTRLVAVGDDGPIALRCEQLVLALGASERFLPFPGWTIPGVCGVGGLQALVKQGLAIRGQRVAIAGSGPLLLAVAASLREHGACVLGIFEQAPRSRVRRFGLGLLARPGKLAHGLGLLNRLRGVPRHHDAWPTRVEVRGSSLRATFRTTHGERTLDVDWLAAGFGLVPNVDVAALLGCRIEDERVVVDEFTRTTIPDVFAVGETIGIAGVEAALSDGITAGLACAGRDADARRAARARYRERRFGDALARTYALRDELRALAAPDTVICRCEDTPIADLAHCADAREAKLLARCGMGPCQGRVCGPALAFLRGWSRDSVRPPLVPLTFSELSALDEPPCR